MKHYSSSQQFHGFLEANVNQVKQITNWKRIPYDFHWHRGFLDSSMAVYKQYKTSYLVKIQLFAYWKRIQYTFHLHKRFLESAVNKLCNPDQE